uniref:Protein kinase domain-containing protein n=1 Tax=Rhizophagus irregularis (strain DAOM 181602 / DAOM 197198 / MUCL 43194) TaxID=747089 RepID=U9TUI6_RHIID
MQYTSNQDKSSEGEEKICEICKLKYSFESFCEHCVRKVLVMIFPRYLPRDVDDSTKNEYNNIAYMAPEIIFGGQRTPESDIYSFGMLLLEISSGKIPYHGYVHNSDLKVKVFSGMRPKILLEDHLEYHELINQCLDAIPSKRPILATVFEKLKIDEKDVYVNSQSLQSSSHTTISENGFKGLPEPKNATPEEQEEFHKELFKLNEDKVDPNLHPDDQDELEIPEQVHAGTTKSKPKTSFKSKIDYSFFGVFF